MGTDGKRVELIDEGASSNAGSYIGLGLIASLIVGFSPLLDAVQGNGPFESAMLRFLACLAVCVVAATILGRMLDSVPDDDPGGVPGDGPENNRAGAGETGPEDEIESPLLSEQTADGHE